MSVGVVLEVPRRICRGTSSLCALTGAEHCGDDETAGAWTCGVVPRRRPANENSGPLAVLPAPKAPPPPPTNEWAPLTVLFQPPPTNEQFGADGVDDRRSRRTSNWRWQCFQRPPPATNDAERAGGVLLAAAHERVKSQSGCWRCRTRFPRLRGIGVNVADDEVVRAGPSVTTDFAEVGVVADDDVAQAVLGGC